MSKIIKLIPAVLSENIDDYKKLADIYSKFSDYIHIDVMDGSYVETKSPDIKTILETLVDHKIKKNIHLMAEYPLSFLPEIFMYDNVDVVYIHANTISRDECNLILEKFSVSNCRFALVFNIDDDLSIYRDFLNKVKVVQLMTVEPGRQSNEFNLAALENISRLKAFGYKGEIHIDGGVNQITLEKILDYKPDVLNVGSAIAKSSNPHSAYYELVSLVSSKFKFV